MCDYSLHNVASRPAKVGEKLVSTIFPGTITRGFAAADAPSVAVCLRPGTEVVFDEEIKTAGMFRVLPLRKMGEKTARFRQVNLEDPTKHHDALELPNGAVVLVTNLAEGQTATVLQLPVEAKPASAHPDRVPPVRDLTTVRS